MKKPETMDPKSKAKLARAKMPARKADPVKVEGEAAPRRADRPAYKRGGAVKGKGSTVNVIIAPQGGGAGGPPGGAPMPVPMPPRPMGGPPPMGAPMGPPPGPGPGMPPPGGAGLGAPPPPGAFRRGGPVLAGAGSGMSRMQRSR